MRDPLRDPPLWFAFVPLLLLLTTCAITLANALGFVPLWPAILVLVAFLVSAARFPGGPPR